MSKDDTGHNFRDQLQALSDVELEDFYVRARVIATSLLRDKTGYDVQAIEANELIHRAYIAVMEGGRSDGSASSLIQFFAGVMWSIVDHIVRTQRNKTAHLSIVLPNEVEFGTISTEKFRTSVALDPEAQTIEADLRARVIGLFSQRPDVQRYIVHRENDNSGTEAEDAAELDLPEATVRNIRRSLARGFRRLRTEGA